MVRLSQFHCTCSAKAADTRCLYQVNFRAAARTRPMTDAIGHPIPQVVSPGNSPKPTLIKCKCPFQTRLCSRKDCGLQAWRWKPRTQPGAATQPVSKQKMCGKCCRALNSSSSESHGLFEFRIITAWFFQGLLVLINRVQSRSLGT